MAASYPASVKSFTAINDGDTVSDEMWEEAYDEVTAMQQALLTTGFEHNLFPESTGDARTLGTSSKYWGLSYLKAVSLLDASELTIASDAVVVTQGYHKIDTEADAATDNLATLTATGLAAGFITILRAEDTSRVVTVKDGTGNLLLNGDYVMSATDRTIMLIYDGTNWRELARSVPPSTDGITTSSSKVTQIAFAAAQSASADANTLDDYEEGTWTPVLGGAGGTSGQAYSADTGGRYVKIGQLVVAGLFIQLDTEGTITGNAEIQGLPFTSMAGPGSQKIFAAALIYAGLATNWVSVLAVVNDSATAAALIGCSGTAGDTNNQTALAAAAVANGTTLRGTIIYRASA